MRTHNRNAESGFSLIELLVVLGLIGTVAGMAIMASPSYTRQVRADSGVAQALSVLRTARDAAVSQRRNVEVQFVGTDTVVTARIEIPSGTKTVLSTTKLDNRMQFLLQTGVPNTPDLFLPFGTSAIAFGTSLTRMFTSEGTFVDANGDVLNGSLFLSVPGEVPSARAITVFGPTGLLRAWRWDGVKWVG